MCRWTNKRHLQLVFVAMVMYREVYSEIKVDNTTCFFKVYDISHDTYRNVDWDGHALPANCRLGFAAPDDSSQTCITVNQFEVPDCDFITRIYQDSSLTAAKKTYTCKSSHDQYCVDGRKYTYMEFVTSFNQSNHRSGFVQFRVKVNTLYTVLESIAGSIASVIFFGCFIIFFVKAARNQLKNCTDTVCEYLGGLVGAIHDCLRGCMSCITDGIHKCVGSCEYDSTREGCVALICSHPQSPEQDATSVQTERPETRDTQTSTDVDSIEFDDIMIHESEHPSAPPVDDRWAPPPYVGPPPVDDRCAPPPYVGPPPDALPPESPPPSYYELTHDNIMWAESET